MIVRQAALQKVLDLFLYILFLWIQFPIFWCF